MTTKQWKYRPKFLSYIKNSKPPKHHSIAIIQIILYI